MFETQNVSSYYSRRAQNLSHLAQPKYTHRTEAEEEKEGAIHLLPQAAWGEVDQGMGIWKSVFCLIYSPIIIDMRAAAVHKCVCSRDKTEKAHFWRAALVLSPSICYGGALTCPDTGTAGEGG